MGGTSHHCQASQLSAKLYQEVQGTLKWYSIDYWTEQLKIDIPSLKRSVVSKISIRPNVELFLSKLQKLNKRLLLVTNAHPETLSIKVENAKLVVIINV